MTTTTPTPTPTPTPESKWALITGCGPRSTSGAVEATAFRNHGINVLATSPSFPSTQSLQHSPPPPNSSAGFLIPLHLDPTDPVSVSRALYIVSQLTGGRLGFLVHLNGDRDDDKGGGGGKGGDGGGDCGDGSGGRGGGAAAAGESSDWNPLLDVDIPRAKRRFERNFWGTLEVTRACFPLLREGRGVVVCRVGGSSLGGRGGIAGTNFRPFTGIQTSEQAALMGLMGVMRLELEPFGVKVVAWMSGEGFGGGGVGKGKGRGVGRLVKGSLYEPVRGEVEDFMAKLSGEGMGNSAHDGDDDGSGVERYRAAERMVEELLKAETPRCIWDGSIMATLMWWLHLLLPMWLLDWASTRGSGLQRLKTLVASEDSPKED